MSAIRPGEKIIAILLVSPLLPRASVVFQHHGCQLETSEQGQLVVFPVGTTREPLPIEGEAVLTLPDGWQARQMNAYEDKNYVFYFKESMITTS